MDVFNNMYRNNPSATRIINEAIRKANGPTMKYNESFSRNVEELTGEPNDRTAYDTGNDPEPLNQ